MAGILKALLCELVALAAPLVTLVYRRGWFVTPDDPVSPHGMYEPMVRSLHNYLPTWLVDWYWLGIRNRAYGFAYLMKPEHFKRMTVYLRDVTNIWAREDGPSFARLRTICIDGYKEWTMMFPFFHVIVGYRLRPIRDEVIRSLVSADVISVRPINMDARPIISIRAGRRDD